MWQRKKLSPESDLDHQLIVKVSWYVDMLVSQAHSLPTSFSLVVTISSGNGQATCFIQNLSLKTHTC